MNLRDRLRRMILNEQAILELHEQTASMQRSHADFAIKTGDDAAEEARRRITMYKTLLNQVDTGVNSGC